MSIIVGGDSVAEFRCNILQSSGKLGKLPTDENGYREICVGAFGVENDVGELYACTQNVESMLAENGDFNRRIAKSFLRGEAGHPVRMPGEDADAFLARVLGIDIKNTTHHIKHVRLVPSRDEKGNPIKLCMATLKPSGIKGDQLEKMLLNPDENVAFSIRCFTKLITLSDGRQAKDIHHIVTWDLVNEPGISLATKYDSPSLESSKIIVTPELLEMASSPSNSMFGFENANGGAAMVRSNLGWQKVQIINPNSATNW